MAGSDLKRVLFVFLLAFIGWEATATEAHAGDYVVLSQNDIGMHCMDTDFSVFSILPPGNHLQAQLVHKAVVSTFPSLVTNFDVTMRYRAARDPAGLINTTSARKTNFWSHVESLFGVSPAVNTGLLGQKMPGSANVFQPFSIFDAGTNRFGAAGIPITSKSDTGTINPYPLMLVSAISTSSKQQLSSGSIVVPVSAEMHCSKCHATGKKAASPGFAGVITWSTRTNIDFQSRENILILHDALNNTGLMAAKPVLCGQCHYSAAVDLLSHGKLTPPTPTQKEHGLLSKAMHLHHGSPQARSGGVVPVPDQGLTTCYSCHPGQTTKCLRGAMASAGLVCQRCHGGLLAVGGKFPLRTGKYRRPWIDLPRCHSCHTGDALTHRGNSIILRRAYNSADPAATPYPFTTDVFASTVNYKDSFGHAGLACESCHGAPHSEWPSQQPNDNVAAIQIQGHSGMISECKVCHVNNLPPMMGGPHGMHNVNDAEWVTVHHPSFYLDNATMCKSCHGASLDGTVISKAQNNRTFTVAGVNISIPRGTPVSCSRCHAKPL